MQVKDVVGYDALGHCFFTEDGPEERNTFDHCLGLLVKPSTLLPSDRDSRMCKLITEGAYPGYIPKPRQDCRWVGASFSSVCSLQNWAIKDSIMCIQLRSPLFRSGLHAPRSGRAVSMVQPEAAEFRMGWALTFVLILYDSWFWKYSH